MHTCREILTGMYAKTFNNFFGLPDKIIDENLHLFVIRPMQSVMCGYALESIITRPLCVIAYDVDVLIFTQLRYSHDKCPGT